MSVTRVDQTAFQTRAHFKECTIYQVYPASFCDSNGDGIGDIQGMISKLDYLKDLGVDAIWLSPVFSSPFIDNGYDISDYQDIHPQFGTLDDVDQLITEVHDRGMKLVMDLVINHTSDQHKWFIESRKGDAGGEFKDYYIWKKGVIGEDGMRREPNNWREEFSNGSAWEWDEGRGEYYLHLYCKEQPDLNWENPALRKAVYEEIMIWWLERGCDGFRMDVINLISKVPSLPDATIADPNEKYQWPYEHTANGPRVHEFLQEMNREVLSKYPHAITVGETPFTHHDFDVLVPYVLPENKELQMIFQFEQQEVDGYPQLVPCDYTLQEFKKITSRWQVGMQEKGGWNSIYLENHDVARSVSRFGDTSTPTLRSASAKLLAMMQCTLTGTMYIYQGEEIGMANLPPSWGIEEYKDIASQTYYAEELALRKEKEGIENPNMGEIMDGIQRKARDHARNPMQWSSNSNAGFSTKEGGKEPWMRVNDDYREWNVEDQVGREGSVLEFWKRMLRFRKKYLGSIYGNFTHYAEDDERVYAYTKEYKEEKLAVLLNFTSQSVEFEVPKGMRWKEGEVKDWIGNGERGEVEIVDGRVSLGAWEGVVVVL